MSDSDEVEGWRDGVYWSATKNLRWIITNASSKYPDEGIRVKLLQQEFIGHVQDELLTGGVSEWRYVPTVYDEGDNDE